MCTLKSYEVMLTLIRADLLISIENQSDSFGFSYVLYTNETNTAAYIFNALKNKV